MTTADLKTLIKNCITLENDAVAAMKNSCDISASDYADAEESLCLHGERRYCFEQALAEKTLIKIGDLEPSCPACKSANAMLGHWEENKGSGLKCRDCGKTVFDYVVESREMNICSNCKNGIYPGATFCPCCGARA